MSKEEYYDQFIAALRPYFHYLTEISIIHERDSSGKMRDVVVIKDILSEDTRMFAIDGYYPDYKKGNADIDVIAKYCYMGFLTMVSPDMVENNQLLLSWEDAKKTLVFRVEGLFEPDPYDYLAKLEWNGLNFIFQLDLEDYIVYVTNKLLEIWGIDIGTLFEWAQENTRQGYKPALVTSPEEEDKLSLEIGKTSSKAMLLYEVDGEEDSEEGSRCLTYNWLMEAIAKEIGSFYALPTDAGNVLILAETGLFFDKDKMLLNLIGYTKNIDPKFRIPAVIMRYDAQQHVMERIA